MNKPKHDFEVWMKTHVRIRVVKFPANDFETLEDQEEALFDLIRDYRISCRKLKENPNSKPAAKMKKECETFLLNATNIDGKSILYRLNNENGKTYGKEIKQ